MIIIMILLIIISTIIMLLTHVRITVHIVNELNIIIQLLCVRVKHNTDTNKSPVCDV